MFFVVLLARQCVRTMTGQPQRNPLAEDVATCNNAKSILSDKIHFSPLRLLACWFNAGLYSPMFLGALVQAPIVGCEPPHGTLDSMP